MKKIFVFLFTIVFILSFADANAQLVFGKTSRCDLTPVTALTLSAAAKP